MDKHFRSIYADHITSFIAHKRKLGYKYEAEAYSLHQIDQLAFFTKQNEQGITKEFAKQWLELRPNESLRTRYQRAVYLVRLSSYITDLGIISYIPRMPPNPSHDFIPFIFSRDEIIRLFEISDNLVFSQLGHNVNLFSMPLLLRFLYSTGIRKGEALSLLDEDINLLERYITIKNSKNGRQRVIPISSTLAKQCEKYLKYRDYLPKCSVGPKYFFVGTLGKKINRSSLETWFKQCTSKLNKESKWLGGSPRVHDLRHTFAITSLVRMADEGVDLYASLPILSNYLGHTSISSTEKYVRLTAKIYPNVLRGHDFSFINIFPIFKQYEAD